MIGQPKRIRPIAKRKTHMSLLIILPYYSKYHPSSHGQGGIIIPSFSPMTILFYACP